MCYLNTPLSHPFPPRLQVFAFSSVYFSAFCRCQNEFVMAVSISVSEAETSSPSFRSEWVGRWVTVSAGRGLCLRGRDPRVPLMRYVEAYIFHERGDLWGLWCSGSIIRRNILHLLTRALWITRYLRSLEPIRVDWTWPTTAKNSLKDGFDWLGVQDKIYQRGFRGHADWSWNQNICDMAADILSCQMLSMSAVSHDAGWLYFCATKSLITIQANSSRMSQSSDMGFC